MPFLKTMIARALTKVANAMVEKYTDPILFIFGMATWGIRIAEIASRGDSGDRRKEPEPESGPSGVAERSNGKPSKGVPPASPPIEVLEQIGSGRIEVPR